MMVKRAEDCKHESTQLTGICGEWLHIVHSEHGGLRCDPPLAAQQILSGIILRK